MRALAFVSPRSGPPRRDRSFRTGSPAPPSPISGVRIGQTRSCRSWPQIPGLRTTSAASTLVQSSNRTCERRYPAPLSYTSSVTERARCPSPSNALAAKELLPRVGFGSFATRHRTSIFQLSENTSRNKKKRRAEALREQEAGGASRMVKSRACLDDSLRECIRQRFCLTTIRQPELSCPLSCLA